MTRKPRTRTMSLSGTALVTLLAGLAVVAGPAPTEPASARLVSSVAAAPGRYTPREGTLHNNPLGTRAAQYRLFRHINRSIRSSPPGSYIRFAVFSFSDTRTAKNLIAAHRRGVHVQLVFNGHAMYDAEKRLRRAFGTNRHRRSYTIFCKGTCRSGRGEMHAKVYQFSRAGNARFVTMIGSNNMTTHNAERQWSDLTTLIGAGRVYKVTWRWFYQLTKDRPVRAPRIATHQHGVGLQFLPHSVAAHGDPVLRALQPVRCAPARTQVRISMHAWFGPRGRRIADRVAQLARQGCLVRVFHGEAFGSKIRRTLARSGVRIATSWAPGVKTHQKLLVVNGRYGSNPSARHAWTGSHNWTPRALKIEDAILRVSRPSMVVRLIRVFDWKFARARRAR